MKTVTFALVLAVFLSLNAMTSLFGQTEGGKKKILIAYFSKTGNTAKVAEAIRKNTDGAMFQIVPETAYPEDQNETVAMARKEVDSRARPAIKGKVENIDSYDVVFVGFPNWWATAPMAVFTFLESHDFSGKTIIPFVTHEGSAFGRSVSDITNACPKATILKGLAIRGSDADSAETRVPEWLKELNY